MLNQRYFPKYKAPHRIGYKRVTKPKTLSALFFTLAVTSALTCFLLKENPVSVEFRSDMPAVVSQIDTDPIRRKLGHFPLIPIGNIGETNSVVSSNFSSTDFSYSGTYSFVDDGDGNCRIRFLTSGTFTPSKDFIFDLFLVGAGGGGRTPTSYPGGGGGAGGYVATYTSITLHAGVACSITVGAGGSAGNTGGTTTFTANGTTYSAVGGNGATSSSNGAAGGSGGAAGGGTNSKTGKVGGSNGSYGGYNSSDSYSGGAGDGLSKYEFGNTSLALYAGGGGGGSHSDNGGAGGAGGAGGGGAGGNRQENGYNGTANTGGGGGGAGGGYSKIGGSGGSGIAILRNHRAA